jgi:hypothetical protein
MAVFLLLLKPLHGIGLSWTCLPVGKDGRMVALQTLLNEVVDVRLLVKVLLSNWLIEYVVKIEAFMGVSVINLDFFAGLAYFDVGVDVPVLDLCF